MLPNPWRRFAEDWPQLHVEYADLGFRHGLTRWVGCHPVAVVLHSALTQRQRRVAIAHECEHLDRGRPCETLRATIEQRVLDATAKWLLPDLDQIAEIVAVYDLHQAAEALWVTYPCLVDRFRCMSNDELEYVLDRQRREHIA